MSANELEQDDGRGSRRTATGVSETGATVKRTKKFLRMKALLKRVMSSEAARHYRTKLEDWRDCQALVECGFQIMGTTDGGTIFHIEGMGMAVQAGLPEYLRK